MRNKILDMKINLLGKRVFTRVTQLTALIMQACLWPKICYKMYVYIHVDTYLHVASICSHMYMYVILIRT